MSSLDKYSWQFIKLLSFRILIVFSYQMMTTVVGWHIYELENDVLALGLVGLSEVIPYFCCALFAGYAVDHFSRRMFGLIASILMSLNGFTLFAVAEGWAESNPAIWVYGAIALTGVARAFISPTYNALFALVLPREKYAKASGLSSSVLQMGLVFGPALGGLLVWWGDKGVAYGVATCLCLFAALVLRMVRFKEPVPIPRVPIFASIGEGLHFVLNNQILLGALSLDMFAVLFGGAIAMLPAFIQSIFHYGPEGLGILRSAPAVGAVMTGLIMAHRPINLYAGRWLLTAVAGFGLCMIGFALSVNFWVGCMLLMLSGVFDGISVVMRTTIMQLVTPDAMRGRVSAINGLFIGSSNELGAFESGIAARWLGLVPSVVYGGVMTLAIVIITAKSCPKLRRLALHQLN